MSRLIDRYFIKEFMAPFFFSLFALTFILLMDQLFRLIDLLVRKGLAMEIVFQILIYTLPLIVSYTTPMAILIAIVMSFGRFGQDNEILALKTSGISFLSIMKTPAIIALGIMGFLVVFNNYILPESNHRVRNLMLDVARKRPAIRLTEGTFSSDFPGYTIYIRQKDERASKIYDVTIYDLQNSMIITAPRGDLKNLEEQGIMQFILYDGELHQLVDSATYQKTQFPGGTMTINMKLNADLERKDRKSRSEDELDARLLLQNIGALSAEINRLKEEVNKIGRDAIDNYLSGDERSPAVAKFQVDQKLSVIKSKTRSRSRYLIELHRKFSLAFACLVFLIIGAPLGYLFRRGGIAGVLVGILLFSLYYILVISGEELANRKNTPAFWAMWLPNFILLAPGFILFWIAEYEHLPWRRRRSVP